MKNKSRKRRPNNEIAIKLSSSECDQGNRKKAKLSSPEAKRYVPRKKAMTSKPILESVDAITQKYAKKRRLFVSTTKERNM